MVVGTVASIWRYPVKSLRPEPMDAAEVELSGVSGDRTAAYHVRTPDHPRAGKVFRGKEHATLHLTSSDAAVRAIAVDARVDVELLDGERFFDAAPISILVDRWLEALSSHVGYAVEAQRFRPNFAIAASPDFLGDEWALDGRTLTLGSTVLRVRKPIERCVVPTYDLRGGASDPRILRYIGTERDNRMGIYCDVVTPGIVRTGDRLESR
jgi:uncharacterized protein YcbX